MLSRVEQQQVQGAVAAGLVQSAQRLAEAIAPLVAAEMVRRQTTLETQLAGARAALTTAEPHLAAWRDAQGPLAALRELVGDGPAADVIRDAGLLIRALRQRLQDGVAVIPERTVDGAQVGLIVRHAPAPPPADHVSEDRKMAAGEPAPAQAGDATQPEERRERRRVVRPPAFWEPVRADYEAGMSWGDIEIKHGVGAGTLSKQIKAGDWQRKVSGEPAPAAPAATPSTPEPAKTPVAAETQGPAPVPAEARGPLPAAPELAPAPAPQPAPPAAPAAPPAPPAAPPPPAPVLWSRAREAVLEAEYGQTKRAVLLAKLNAMPGLPLSGEHLSLKAGQRGLSAREDADNKHAAPPPRDGVDDTAAMKRQARELFAAGMSARAVDEELDCGLNAASAWLAEWRAEQQAAARRRAAA